VASRSRRVALIADTDQQSCVSVCTLVRALGLAPELAGTGAGVLAAVEDDLPTLVILAVDLCEPSAYEVLRRLREQAGENLPLAVLSARQEQQRDEIASLMLGADDYFPKPVNPDRFTARVRRLLARSITPSLRPALTTTPTPNDLARRERQVLDLLVQGSRPAEIAESLCITKKTAATHIEHILAKLGVHTQAQAVAFALRGENGHEREHAAAAVRIVGVR
jgi:DNA-binding NarL/FixJ family response regulator